MNPILHAKNLSVAYGDAVALWNVDVFIQPGELVAVVGPNGAGKTTLVNALMRILPIRSGELSLNGEVVTSLGAQAMCERGVSIIPEGRKLFGQMSVEDNLRMGSYIQAARGKFKQRLEFVYDLFPRLQERRQQLAGTMSGGERQMLAVGRALMSEPRLLMLDEPSLGLAPAVVDTMYDAFAALHKDGLTILLAEQSVDLALEAADHAYVLQVGRTVLQGPAQSLANNPDVQRIYLGIE